MWIWLVAVAGNHISAVMLRPGYERRLSGFENKHTSQIEPGDMRPETSQKIISNLRSLLSISPPLTSALCVSNMCPCFCICLPNADWFCMKRKGRFSILSLLPIQLQNKLICCLFAFIHVSLVLSPSRPQTRTLLDPETSAQDDVFVKKKKKKSLTKAGELIMSVVPFTTHPTRKHTHPGVLSLTATKPGQDTGCILLVHVKR